MESPASGRKRRAPTSPPAFQPALKQRLIQTFETDCGLEEYEEGQARLRPDLQQLAQELSGDFSTLSNDAKSAFMMLSEPEDIRAVCSVSSAVTRFCHNRQMDSFWKEKISELRGRSIQSQRLEQVAPGQSCWFKAWLNEYDVALQRLLRFIQAAERPLGRLRGGRMVAPYAALDRHELINMTRLDLDDMELSEIPREIGLLSQLTSLDLSSNKLSTLPPEIGNLIRLETLRVAANQLTELPCELGKLNNLRYLLTTANPLPQEWKGSFKGEALKRVLEPFRACWQRKRMKPWLAKYFMMGLETDMPPVESLLTAWPQEPILGSIGG